MSFKDGDDRLILKTQILIPEQETWLHENHKAKESVLRGLEQAKMNLLKKNAIDLDSVD